MTLGDRIVIMKDGFIQQIGTPQEVFDHPANLFVAGFIGTPQMNFFDAELVKQDGRYAVVLDGMTVALSDEKQERLAAKGVGGQHVTLGVRPQHVSLQCESGSVKARMDVFEMMGSEIHLHANMNGRDMVIIVPTMDISGDYSDAFTIGKEIDFSFSGSACTCSAPTAGTWSSDLRLCENSGARTSLLGGPGSLFSVPPSSGRRRQKSGPGTSRAGPAGASAVEGGISALDGTGRQAGVDLLWKMAKTMMLGSTAMVMAANIAV